MDWVHPNRDEDTPFKYLWLRVLSSALSAISTSYFRIHDDDEEFIGCVRGLQAALKFFITRTKTKMMICPWDPTWPAKIKIPKTHTVQKSVEHIDEWALRVTLCCQKKFGELRALQGIEALPGDPHWGAGNEMV